MSSMTSTAGPPSKRSGCVTTPARRTPPAPPRCSSSLRRVAVWWWPTTPGRWPPSLSRTLQPEFARAPAAIHSRWRCWLVSGVDRARRPRTRRRCPRRRHQPGGATRYRDRMPGLAGSRRDTASPRLLPPSHSRVRVVTYRRPPSRLAHEGHPQNPPRLTPARENAERSSGSRGALGAQENEKRCKPPGADEQR